jgi:hypothetical protein
MYISQTSWGQPKTRPNIFKLFIAIIMAALFALGWRSDFVPSEKWIWISTAISAILTALLTIEYWIIYRSGKLPLSCNGKESKIKTFLCVHIGLPVFLLFFIWVALTHGLASGINSIFGSPYETTKTLVKTYETVKLGCDYHLRGDYLKTAVPDYLCISKEYYESNPKTVMVILSGKNTYLGLLIEMVREEKL